MNPKFTGLALLRAGRRGLQMVLRLLAHNAEHWLATHLNAYLQDDDEYRAITRETIIRGLAGTITYTRAAITVELSQPGSPRVTRSLELLLGCFSVGCLGREAERTAWFSVPPRAGEPAQLGRGVGEGAAAAAACAVSSSTRG